MLVQINVDVYAYYKHQPPVYRFWVNDTLYNEREFWVDCLSNYIEEEMYVELEPGKHTFLIEKVTTDIHSKIWVEKFVVKYNETVNTVFLNIDPQDKQIINFEIG
jgi:hypothetical protein